MDLAELTLNPCSNDSDTDSDNNNDVKNNVEPLSIKSSISESSLTSIDNTESYNIFKSNNVAHAINNEGIVEKNDDSNDSDYVQSSERQKELMSSQNNTCKTEFIKSFSNPLLGNSSTYIINAKLSIPDERIKEVALNINALLPVFSYNRVLEAVQKNRYTRNYIERSLWDLLPRHKPLSMPVTEKFLNDISVKNVKTKSETEHSKNDIFSTLSMEHKVLQNDILRPAKLIVDNKPFSVEHVTSINVPVSHPSRLKYVSSEQYNINTTSTSSLRKHKINESISKSSVLGKNVFSSNNSNIDENQMLYNYMQYLNCMQNIKKQKLSGKYVNFNKQNEIQKEFFKLQHIDRFRNALSTKRVSKTLNVNLSKVEINTESCADSLPNILQNSNSIFSDMATNTLSTASIKDPNISLHQDTPSITIIESSVSPTQPTEMISSINSDITSTVMPCLVATSSCESLTFKSLSVLNTKLNSNTVLPDTDNTKVTEVFNEPLTSTGFDTKEENVDNTGQIFGGTKKKMFIRKENSTINVENKIKKENISNFQHLYESVVLLFPEMSKDYIKEICESYSAQDVSLCKQLEELTRFILLNKKSVETNTVKADEKDDCDMDEKYIYLSGIFPDADTAYLKKIVARIRNDPNALTEFIHTQWSDPTYITKEEKLRRKRITEQQKQYTSKFDVKEFLKLFPDPFIIFENPNKKCNYSSDALEFLKFHFNKFEVTILKNTYEDCNHHLTLTANKLENMEPTKKKGDYTSLWEQNLSEDILLLQECAFIKHKKEIKEYQDMLKQKETIEFEELKERNALLQCQCCYDDCLPSKCSTCDDGHIFCNACILKGTELQLAQGDARIGCFDDCDGEFRLSTLQNVLSPMQFSILIRKKQEAEVMAAGLEGLVSCPFCHFATIPPPEDKIFKCLNPECMKESCRLCKELNHIPLKCYEEKTDKARLLLEEKMTEALVRKCHTCLRPYFKEEGCNKITCSCGSMMCYLCDKQISGYDHFNRGICPLWSDSRSMNTATVEVVAKKVVEYVKTKEPNVNMDLSTYVKNPNHDAQQDQAVLQRARNVANFDT